MESGQDLELKAFTVSDNIWWEPFPFVTWISIFKYLSISQIPLVYHAVYLNLMVAHHAFDVSDEIYQILKRRVITNILFPLSLQLHTSPRRRYSGIFKFL